MFTEIGDVSEILKRDQRTIKNTLVTMDTIQVEFCGGECKKSKSNNFSISRFPVMFFRISNLGMYTIADSNYRTCSAKHKTYSTRINLNNFMKRLVQVFIFGVCLLSVVRIPTAMSAPMSCREWDEPEGNVPKWKNPCGQELVMDNSSGGSSSGENDKDKDIISPILTAAKIALEYMQNFRQNYVEGTFHVSYDMHVSITRHSAHLWLPDKETEVPKYIGEKADIAHFKSQKLDKFLQSIYESMQKYAVGIEQVVLDQQNSSGKFRHQFNETESNLRKVLCELRMAMFNKNITPLNKVERCIMDQNARRINETAHRNLRDWIIFRECMNGLEYLIQVLEHLEAINTPTS